MKEKFFDGSNFLIDGLPIENGDLIKIYVEKITIWKRILIFLRLRRKSENGIYKITKVS